mmetsp:Transcript_19347/g.56322  ORF Transcript_19347/g.56322 Transcript_19347/m.56322 type:complete len:202 (-) Transcript_19347:208-813(-)
MSAEEGLPIVGVNLLLVWIFDNYRIVLSCLLGEIQHLCFLVLAVGEDQQGPSDEDHHHQVHHAEEASDFTEAVSGLDNSCNVVVRLGLIIVNGHVPVLPVGELEASSDLGALDVQADPLLVAAGGRPDIRVKVVLVVELVVLVRTVVRRDRRLDQRADDHQRAQPQGCREVHANTDAKVRHLSDRRGDGVELRVGVILSRF